MRTKVLKDETNIKNKIEELGEYKKQGVEMEGPVHTCRTRKDRIAVITRELKTRISDKLVDMI